MDIMEKLHNRYVIACEDVETRNRVTQILIDDLGFSHGDSGYSKRYYKGSESDMFLCPFISCGNVEYYPTPSNIQNGYKIDAEEFLQAYDALYQWRQEASESIGEQLDMLLS